MKKHKFYSILWLNCFAFFSHTAQAQNHFSDAPQAKKEQTAEILKASDFAIQLPIKANANQGFQKIALPAQALIQLRLPNYNDVAIFNADGQALSMARIQPSQTLVTKNRYTLNPYPILGNHTSDLQQSDISIYIQEKNQTQNQTQKNERTIHLQTQKKQTPAAQKLIAALFDTRKLQDSVTMIELAAKIPAAQPIRFELEASTDLKNWEKVTSTVMYQTQTETRTETISDNSTSNHIQALNLNRLVTGQNIALPSYNLKDKYLRITWAHENVNITQTSQPSSENLPTIELTGATFTTEKQQNQIQTVQAYIQPVMHNTHELSFKIPFSTPIYSINIQNPIENTFVPIQIWGRNNPEQKWRLINQHVIYNLKTSAQNQQKNSNLVWQNLYSEIKITADQKTAGFSEAPKISLEFEQPNLVFLASGRTPFTLAAGYSKPRNDPYFDIQNFLPGYQIGMENQLPLAMLENVNPNPVVVATQVEAEQKNIKKDVWLWLVLIMGVLLLAWMVRSLMKSSSSKNIG